ncbi:MAG: hypothetical protein HY509_01295 [Acidobacteria bacterium]|nr:hypothetical protein [Acidobacteriota bacterium]
MKECPERTLLLEHAASLTKGRRGERLERHVRDCPACAAELEKIRSHLLDLDGAVRELVRREGPSAEFPARLAARLEKAPAGLPLPRAVLAAAAGLVILAAVLVGVRFGPWSPFRPTAGDNVKEMSEWRASTDWLLVGVGDELLSAEIEVGESFFPMGTETNGRNGGQT